jgi:hypothetical protein
LDYVVDTKFSDKKYLSVNESKRRNLFYNLKKITITISGQMSPTYVLEHLATFTVSPENDLVYPADGMRRLLTMEKTNGIW